MIRFEGYRPNPPSDYLAKGVAAPADAVQYEGVLFGDGTVVLRWQTEYRSHSVWASFVDFYRVHGHPEYGTRIEFLDAGAEELCELITKDQDQYIQILPHDPREDGAAWVCSMCGRQAQVLSSMAAANVYLAMMHPAEDGHGDCGGSKQPITLVNVQRHSRGIVVSLPRSMWVDCTEELRERLAGIGVDHMDLGTELLPARNEHDDSGPHRHLLDSDTQADLLRAELAKAEGQSGGRG